MYRFRLRGLGPNNLGSLLQCRPVQPELLDQEVIFHNAQGHPLSICPHQVWAQVVVPQLHSWRPWWRRKPELLVPLGPLLFASSQCFAAWWLPCLANHLSAHWWMALATTSLLGYRLLVFILLWGPQPALYLKMTCLISPCPGNPLLPVNQVCNCPFSWPGWPAHADVCWQWCLLATRFVQGNDFHPSPPMLLGPMENGPWSCFLASIPFRIVELCLWAPRRLVLEDEAISMASFLLSVDKGHRGLDLFFCWGQRIPHVNTFWV